MSGRTRITQALRTAAERRSTRSATTKTLTGTTTMSFCNLAPRDALLLFGPGEAKLQLKDRLGRSKVPSESIVAVESTDKLTDPQIVAKVKEHYGVAR
jgi:hypothetical protein